MHYYLTSRVYKEAYLDVVAYTMGAAHLEEDTVVDYRQVGVVESRAHHCKAICVGWRLKDKTMLQHK